jgi:hypothetical protein
MYHLAKSREKLTSILAPQEMSAIKNKKSIASGRSDEDPYESFKQYLDGIARKDEESQRLKKTLMKREISTKLNSI